MNPADRVMPNHTPVVLEDTATTLREDTFVIRDVETGFPDVACVPCGQTVASVDDGDDLNTLVRLAYAHAITCEGNQS